MKTAILSISLVAVLAFAATPAQAANPPQSGTNGDCLDYNVLYDTPVRSPGAAIVTVDGGSKYSLSQSGGAAVFVDFYDATGIWLGWNNGATTGTAPAAAVSGTICVGLINEYPDAPAPLSTWTYQDGL